MNDQPDKDGIANLGGIKTSHNNKYPELERSGKYRADPKRLKLTQKWEEVLGFRQSVEKSESRSTRRLMMQDKTDRVRRQEFEEIPLQNSYYEYTEEPLQDPYSNHGKKRIPQKDD